MRPWMFCHPYCPLVRPHDHEVQLCAFDIPAAISGSSRSTSARQASSGS
jgi:hypothetical protein